MLRRIQRLPDTVQRRVANLVEDLLACGPIRNERPNSRKSELDKFHGHLARDCVVCWTYKKDSQVIEVYYAGSRKNAPY